MKIVFIEPPFGFDNYNDFTPTENWVCPPLWFFYLATYFKKRVPRAEIHFLDGQILDIREIIKRIHLIKPEVVGISSIWVSYRNALTIARQAKKSGARVIMGGHHANGIAKEILLNRGPCSDDYCVDVVVRGDGERAFYEYAIKKPLDQIDNIVYQKKNSGLIKLNNVQDMDLDESFLLERDLVNISNYFNLSRKDSYHSYKRSLNICSHRGCAWRTISKGGCIFCSRMYRDLRICRPDLVVKEIDYLMNNFDLEFIWDVSDNFFDGEGWFDKFYKLYKDYPNKPIMRIYSRVDNINEEIVKKLQRLNIKQVALGLESGDSSVMAAIRKGVTARRNKQAVRLLASAGISVIGHFVLGAPGESKDSLRKTVDFMQELTKNGIEVMLAHLFKPLPNSIAFRMLQERTGN